jgi:hypothetical protein
MSIIQIYSLLELLKLAESDPAGAVLEDLWTELDGIFEFDKPQIQLQVAGDAITRITDIFAQRSTLAFQELEATTAQDGPVMKLDQFDRYVRQTMQIDLEQYLEPIAKLLGLSTDQDACDLETDGSDNTIAGEVPKSALLQVLEALHQLQSPITEDQQMQQIKSLSHGEDIPLWSSRINAYLHQVLGSSDRTVTLYDLPSALGMPLTEVWLGFLLGDHDYQLQRTGEDFYSAAHIEVILKSDSTALKID